MRTHRLIDTDRHRVTAHLPPQVSDTLVVSFNPIRQGLADTGFGSGLIQHMGYAHVFVAEGGHSQYQALRPQVLRRVLAPLLADHPRVFTYGVSLGGHAALYYATALRAQALALAPRLPLHPYFTPWRSAHAAVLTQGRLRHADLPQVANPQLRPVVLHDPWNLPDATYVDLFVRPAFPQALFLPCRGAGHSVARVLAHQSRLRPLAAQMFQTGDPGPLGYDLRDRPACPKPQPTHRPIAEHRPIAA